MMTSLLFRNQRGFTLLEIVVTLTVAAVLGTIIVLYMDTSLTRSVEPITLIQKTFALNQVIEQVTADYNTLLDTDNNPLSTLKNNIENTTNYGQDSGQADFITFSGFTESSNEGDRRILKAVITLDNRSITLLFTN